MRDDVSTAIRSVVKRLFVVVGGMIGLLNEGFKSKTNCFCLLWVRRTLKGIMFVDENWWKMMRFHSFQDVWPLPANSSNEIDTTKQYIISKNSCCSSTYYNFWKRKWAFEFVVAKVATLQCKVIFTLCS